MRAALERDGFIGNPPIATLLPAVQDLDKFLSSSLAIDLPADRSFVPAIVEVRHWPLVLTDSGLTTYVVPIKPKYAERLFGFSEAMHPLRRSRSLGLSREHVYFCSPRDPITDAPARLLWYVTADDSAEVRLLAARSTLTSATVMTADTAFQRYGRLGVLGKADIDDASDGHGMVRVVRFQETELLEHPIPRRTLMPLLARHKVPTNLPTARRADSKLFDDLIALQSFDIEIDR